MAEVKRTPVVEEQPLSETDFLKELAGKVNAVLKKDTIIVGDSATGDEGVPYWVLTGIPQLDYAIGGTCHPGIPGGRITEFHGAESTGKSTIMLHIVKRAIEQVQAIAYYQDAEQVLTPEIIKGTGVDMNRVMRDQPDTLEEVFDAQLAVLEHLQGNQHPVVMALDSIAACSTASEIDGDMGDHTVGEHARLMSKGLRKIKSSIAENKVLSLWTNQTREKITSGPSWVDNTATFAGKAMNFYASVRVRLSKVKTLKKSTGDPYGCTIEANIVKNKVAPPLRKAQYDILFVQDKGGSYPRIDVEGALLDWLKDHKLIGGSVGRYEIKDKTFYKDGARQFLIENPKVMADLHKQAYTVKLD